MTMVNIPFARPEIGPEEKEAVQNVLNGPILVHGPQATRFEEDFAAYCGAPYAVSVSSCTSGMHLLYFALGYGPGDEVIVPAQTHTATAHAVELVGATPVFVDAELETGNIDIDAIEEAITSNTRAIAVVHYLGMPVDMKRVVAIAKKHDLFVLEDCALAFGTRQDGIHSGLIGDAGVFSFYPVKHMTTAEGGMVILRNESLAADLRLKKAFGVDRPHGERPIPGMYDVITLGLNYRMNELQAAIGIEQVKKLDHFLHCRKENYETLELALSGVDDIDLFQSSYPGMQSSYYCLSVILSDKLTSKRPEIMSHMKEAGVGTSIYYPRAVPHMTYYRRKYNYTLDQFCNAAKISNNSIALPVGPHLNVGDPDAIAKTLVNSIRKVQE
jgi:perosamine synthetase